MAPKYRDYYKALGVPRTATAEQLHDAFRRLARKYHPDVNPGNKNAEEKFKAITEAYEVLGDPAKRRHYDSLGDQWKAGQEFSPPSGWESLFRFGRGSRPAAAEGAPKSRGGFSEFFNSLFGGRQKEFDHGPEGAAPMEEPPRSGANIEAEVTITLEQAYHGGRTAVAVRMPGAAAGGGSRPTLRRYEIKIPPGIHDGARIRLAGQGRPADKKGLPPGDLFIRVRITPHATFRLRGDDLEMDLPITPWEAALGRKISVPTLDGSVEMALPAGSQSGQRMRLRGKGMPNASHGRGDQYAVLKIVVPETLSGRERELFEQLAHDSSFKPRP
jgi:curved DNA-binding protein